MTNIPTAHDETDKGLRQIDFRQLGRDSRSILRTFDKWALGAAIAALIVMLVAGVTPILAFVLSPAVYAGIALARPHRQKAAPRQEPILTTEEEQAFLNAGAATANIMTQARLIPNRTVRRQVRAVGANFGKMLDAMQADKRYRSAPDYYNLLVHGFEQQMISYMRMIERKVNLAQPQVEHFEENIVPRTLTVAESFYQDYHLNDVLDLATLIEMHKLNLDNIDGTDLENDEDAYSNGDGAEPDRENPALTADNRSDGSNERETRGSK